MPPNFSFVKDHATDCECGRVAVVIMTAKIGNRRNITAAIPLCCYCAAEELAMQAGDFARLMFTLVPA